MTNRGFFQTTRVQVVPFVHVVECQMSKKMTSSFRLARKQLELPVRSRVSKHIRYNRYANECSSLYVFCCGKGNAKR